MGVAIANLRSTKVTAKCTRRWCSRTVTRPRASQLHFLVSHLMAVDADRALPSAWSLARLYLNVSTTLLVSMRSGNLGLAGLLLCATSTFLGGVQGQTTCTPAATPLVGVNNLVGFSIESDRWPEWTGGIDTPNTFWINTLNNLKILCEKLHNLDRTTFVATQFEPTVGLFPNYTSTTPYPEATSNTIGPSFYLLSKHLPSGTRMTWGLNLGANSSTNAIAEAKSIAAAFASSDITSKNIVLELLEAGNEPDLYKNNGLRNTTYTVANWQTDWVALAGSVSTALGIKKGSLPSWISLSFAGGDHGNGGFSPQQAYANGLLSTTAGSLITVVSQHRYSGSFCTGSQGLLSDLMSKLYIRGNVTVWKPDIAATEVQGLKYWLGETNSYACHGAPGVSNTAGAAIWMLDYSLQAAVQRIEEVYYHHGIGFKYNFMQPVALNRSITTGESVPIIPAHVQPTYYAAIALAEAIGTSGGTTVAEIETHDAGVAGYAIYDGTALARAVFLNSQAYSSASTGARPAVRVQVLFTGASGAPAHATLKRLKIAHADDTANVTWGGVSYETATGLAAGSVVTETVVPSDGFVLAATEAVLITFT
ncbi:hypothetical protein BKA62DRAFT_681430 [Auriculariales sp. MPI-PUGE-AT-0066]|nr:hypothetical protein BKA62DRAFT_681430 [Auriculariales sp. MPI-PUGE-AT-0066]